MSDIAKIAAVGVGVGLAVYGLVRLFTRKCKKCGGETFKLKSERKIRKYIKNQSRSYYKTQTIQKQTITISHHYREPVLIQQYAMEYQCMTCGQVQKQTRTVRKQDFEIDLEDLKGHQAQGEGQGMIEQT